MLNENLSDQLLPTIDSCWATFFALVRVSINRCRNLRRKKATRNVVWTKDVFKLKSSISVMVMGKIKIESSEAKRSKLAHKEHAQK